MLYITDEGGTWGAQFLSPIFIQLCRFPLVIRCSLALSLRRKGNTLWHTQFFPGPCSRAMHTSTARLDNINLFLPSAGEIQGRKTELSTLKHWSVMRPPEHGPQLDLCPLCHSVLSPHLLQHTHRVCTPSHVTLFWPVSFSNCTSCWSKVDQLYLQTLCVIL